MLICYTILSLVHVSDSNLIAFFDFRSGCGHCKKAKPEFVTAAEHFKEDPRTDLAAVDCTRHSSLCGVYSVKGYPTIKYFSYLKTIRDYDGGRTVR